jgi:hypothetical protein
MGTLNLRVGAAVDRNMSVAFQPLIDGAKRAKAAIEAEGNKAGRAIGTGVKKGASQADAAMAELTREISTGMTKALAKGGSAAQAFGKDAQKSFQTTKKSFADMAKDVEKQLAVMERAKKKAGSQNFGGAVREYFGGAGKAAGVGGSKGGFEMAGSIAGTTMGLAKKAIGSAVSIAKSIARGAGVDMDLGSIVKKNTDLETNAQNISNSGVIANDPRNNLRVSKETLMREAMNVGEKTGSDANVALEGLGKFVSKTGDLKTGRDLMEQMATYSKATGSSMEDMMDGAGDLANQLDGVENKSQVLKDLMRGFVGQGKLGAVEIKDLASQMAKIGAASSRFEGGQKSIVEMGVLAQSARGKGGAATANIAATAVSSFANLFSKGKRQDAFTEMGVETGGTGGKVRDPKAIIMDALRGAERKGGGNVTTIEGAKKFDRMMGRMFADVSSRRTVLGFEDKFKQAGGGEAGIKAATEEFERLEKAMVSDEEIMKSFAMAMKTTESQSEILNNQWRKQAAQIQTDVMPHLIKFGQALIPAVESLGSWVSFMTGDKGTKDQIDAAKDEVESAAGATKKQLEGGKISDAQIEQNKGVSKRALLAKHQAWAELNAAEETLASKKKNDEYGAGSEGGWGIPWSNQVDDPNSILGRVFGTSEKGDQQRVDDKKKQLAAADANIERMATANDEVARLLAGELVVRIANVDELKATQPGAAVDGAARQPAPGKKAR